MDNIETPKIPGPCKTCGSPDRYFDSKGFARCRPCRKKAVLLLGAKKKSSGIPAPMCDVHNIQKYWDNFGNAICSQCRKEAKSNLFKRRTEAGIDPEPCSVHGTPRKWSTEGHATCRLCVNENNIKKLQERLTNNVPAPLCTKHGCKQTWKQGGLYCNQCSREEKKRSYAKVKDTPPPFCEIHQIEKYWNTEGGAICPECQQERRIELGIRRKQEGPPAPCEIHQTPRKWNAHGIAICNLCITERAHQLWSKRIEGPPPTDCEIHGTPRYWNSRGQLLCKQCNRDAAAARGFKKKECGDPTPCEIHSLPRKWSIDGRPICVECRKSYKSSLDKMYYRWAGMNSRCHNKNDTSYYNYGKRGIFVYPEWRRDPDKSFEENYKIYEKFRSWIIENIGDIPSTDHSLDRIDNNKGYEPGNLRWNDRFGQANNTRVNIETKLKVPDDSIIFYPYNNPITLKEFADMVDMPLSVAKYRYAQHPGNVDWILHDEDSERYYEYDGKDYSVAELCLISNIPYKTLHARLKKMEWDVERAMLTPLPNNNYTDNPLKYR